MKLKNKSTGRFVKQTKEQFIEKSNEVHNLKYNYSKVKYINAQTKVVIICPIHGEFLQTPANHKSGNGCRKCSDKLSSNNQKLSTSEFIKRAIKVHGSKYGYDNVKYERHNIKVDILCKKCNSIFHQTPAHHVEGRGCRKCNSRLGWSRTEWLKICNNKKCTPLVYIVRCYNESEQFIKIGITSNTISSRFNSIPYSYEVIKKIEGSADFVYDKEIELHRKYKSFKHKPLISFKGETECFNISIFKLFTC